MPDLVSSSPLATIIRPGAMAESRDRWRELALLGAALVFETDRDQRLVLVEPATAFGWNAGTLLGRPLSALLGPADKDQRFPADRGVGGRRAWLTRPDGSRAAVTLSTAPTRTGGLRGAVQDQDAAERERRTLADALSRRQTVREVARRMRQPVLPDTMIRIGLNEIVDALGAEGAMIVSGPTAATHANGGDPGGPDTGRAGGGGAGARTGAAPGRTGTGPVPLPRILHRAGMALPVPDADALALVARADGAGPDAARSDTGPIPAAGAGTLQGFGRAILFAPIESHFSEPARLALWRDGRSAWLDGDEELARDLAVLLGGVLEHEQVQREFTRQSGCDILTGLLTRDSFRVEATRRLERGGAEGAATTLMVIGLDGFSAVNARHGYENGDTVLRTMAKRLRDTFRPTDLVARLHGDVFAAWLDGADQFAAAERAEALCQHGLSVSSLPEAGAVQLSVGLSTCPAKGGEPVDTMLEQASAALHAVKLAGGGRWHVYNEEVAS